MCAHNACGHGVACQAIRTPYSDTIQVLAQIFHHLTYVSEARFACQLDNLILWCAVLKELHTAHQYNKCLINLDQTTSRISTC